MVRQCHRLSGHDLSKLQEKVEGRGAQRAAVHANNIYNQAVCTGDTVVTKETEGQNTDNKQVNNIRD